MSRWVNREQIARDWNQRGFSCDIWADPPGQVWEDYIHSVDEVIVLIDGRIEIEMNQQTLTPDLGQEIFIPANTFHTVRNIGDTTAHWLYGYQTHQA